ncbi:hypothetical protein E2542_SST30679 [Spatholobus suberectus]|nr:hypothetical protein E2542_SST30679 [Spatholobus suberectus]
MIWERLERERESGELGVAEGGDLTLLEIVTEYAYVVVWSETEEAGSQFANAKKMSLEERNKMASVPSPSPPPRFCLPFPNNQVSHSVTSRSSTSRIRTRLYAIYSQGLFSKVEAATNNGVSHVDDKKPNFSDGLDHLDSPQCIERFRKYDDEYAHRLVANISPTKAFVEVCNISCLKRDMQIAQYAI